MRDSSTVDPSLERLLVECATLPSLPAVAVELLAECRKDDVDLDRVCHLLERDPALATKVLSVANSSMYRRGTAVTTIQRATVVLGANAVTALALSFSLRSQRPGKAGFDFARFWRRALLCATAARVLAQWAQIDPEEALLGGLLQDLGVLALHTAVSNYEAVLQESQGDHERLERLERERLGTGHAEVGAWLAARLRLPAPLARAVAASHARPPGDAATTMLDRCVAVSGPMAEIWLERRSGATSDAAAHAAAEAASAWLALEPSAFDALLAQMSDAAQSFAQPFEVTLPGPDEMASILEQARETLSRMPIRQPGPIRPESVDARFSRLGRADPKSRS